MSTFSLPAIFVDIPRNPVLAVGLPLALGTLSGWPTKGTEKSAWFQGLRNPPGRPPRDAFPYVWSVLYVAMGYASHIAVKALDRSLVPNAAANSIGIKLYWAQLGLNFLWSPLFFGLRRPEVALVDIALLTGTAIYMTAELDKVTEGASTLLLLPYCGWLCVATYLNAGVWWLNRPRPYPKGKGREE